MLLSADQSDGIKPQQPASLPLAHRCAVERVAIGRNSVDANGDHVTAAQLDSLSIAKSLDLQLVWSSIRGAAAMAA